MKRRLKKIFENSAYWTGVVVIGLIVGISIQFARAWVGPTGNPSTDNLGAPINTGILGQVKSGVFGAAAILTHESIKSVILGGEDTPGLRVEPADPNANIVGKALVAINNKGDVAFADTAGNADGGFCFNVWKYSGGSSDPVGCPDSAGGVPVSEFSLVNNLYHLGSITYRYSSAVCCSSNTPSFYQQVSFREEATSGYCGSISPQTGVEGCKSGYSEISRSSFDITADNNCTVPLSVYTIGCKKD